MLNAWLFGELEIYYDDYNGGKFKGLLGDDEVEEIERDLFWCYEHRVKPDDYESTSAGAKRKKLKRRNKPGHITAHTVSGFLMPERRQMQNCEDEWA